MTALSDLIARLEAATEGSRELDEEIAFLLFGRYPHEGIQAYTTSLDAALTLKPDGWQCGFEEAGCADHVRRPEAWCWPNDVYWEPDWQNGEEGYRSHPNATRAVADTLPLAMCAAILKAREAGR